MQITAGNKAGKKVDKIVPFIPEGNFYFTKGVEAFQKSKFDAALKWLRRAVESSPEEALFHCQMSIVYTEIGSYHTANQILMEVLASNGEKYADCYYLIANNYAHLGLLQDAKKYAETYLNTSLEGDFREEAESLLDFIDMDDEEEDDWMFEEEDELLIYQEKIFQLMQQGKWTEAMPVLEEVMELFPENIQAKHEYSTALFYNGQKEQAIKLEKKWLKAEPQSLFSHSNLAIFYHNDNNQKLAGIHTAVLLNVYPIHEQQKLRVASTLAQTGYYEEALKRFKKLNHNIVKGHLGYYKWYSIAAYRTGSPSKALALWEEGCRRHPALGKEDGPWAVF